MDLAGKKVLVVGLGRSGAGVARLCAARGARVTVTDRKPAEDLAFVVAALPAGTTTELGGHPPGIFASADLIVLSPGVPPLPELEAARAAGIPVTGELELAARFLSAPIVAVTGTNGKSTTTALCGAMLAGTGRPTFVGGNLGVPLVEAVGTPAAGPDGLCVVEVSSFQLETAERFAPRIAVLLNISPDHLDRYPDLESYAAAKARIFRAQGPGDYAVVNAEDPHVLGLARAVPGRVLRFSSRHPLDEGGWLAPDALCLRLPDGPVERYPRALPGLIGQHNLENALAASLAARLAGAPTGAVRDALVAFRPLPHRMALVAEVGKVAYYDDSKGTNVGAVVAALDGFPRKVVLIAGGRDKGSDYAPLAKVMRAVGRGAVVVGEAAARIQAALDPVVPVGAAATLEEAVVAAAAMAQPGDAVVLSPACASFDMFRDYAHRGEAFCAAVAALAQAAPAGGSKIRGPGGEESES
jgi:UDP-N-acetylmuramoylalanine--D-glutamate ligase